MIGHVYCAQAGLEQVVQDESIAPQTISTCTLSIENLIYYNCGMQK